jgi:hypothetical protein
LREPVMIQLDKERHPRLTLNAMVAFKKETGKSIMGGFKAEDMTEDDLRALTWACLLHEDKNLTLEAVGDMVDIGNMRQVAEAISKALTQALEDGDPLAQKAPSSTG